MQIFTLLNVSAQIGIFISVRTLADAIRRKFLFVHECSLLRIWNLKLFCGSILALILGFGATENYSLAETATTPDNTFLIVPDINPRNWGYINWYEDLLTYSIWFPTCGVDRSYVGGTVIETPRYARFYGKIVEENGNRICRVEPFHSSNEGLLLDNFILLCKDQSSNFHYFSDSTGIEDHVYKPEGANLLVGASCYYEYCCKLAE